MFFASLRFLFNFFLLGVVMDDRRERVRLQNERAFQVIWQWINHCIEPRLFYPDRDLESPSRYTEHMGLGITEESLIGVDIARGRYPR